MPVQMAACSSRSCGRKPVSRRGRSSSILGYCPKCSRVLCWLPPGASLVLALRRRPVMEHPHSRTPMSRRLAGKIRGGLVRERRNAL